MHGVDVARGDWESVSARNLFLFLLCDRGRRVSEDRIVEAFWPEGGVDKARRAMKTAVYRIRKALKAPDAVVTGERYYQFNATLPHVWDVDLLERAAVRAQGLEAGHDLPAALKEWRQVAALYRGRFLEGMEDEWIQPLRQRTTEIAVAANARCAALLLAGGEAGAAVQAARGALDLDLDLDRCCEEAQATLVQALTALGRRDEAVRAYHAAAEVLNRVLGLGPGPQLVRAWLEATGP